MANEVYVNLAERMNKFEGRYPIVNAYLNVLKTMCTEEEAEFLSRFPEKALTVDEIANLYKKDKSDLIKLLDQMTYKGLLFTAYTEKGDKTYSVIPIVPGAMEYYILRRLDKPDEIKAYLDLYNQMHVESREYVDKLMAENPEKARAYLPSRPIFRTITVDQAIPDKKEVLPFEDIMAMVDKQTSFAGMLCTCKEGIGPATTGPCKVQGVPRHHCLQFGQTADFAVEQNIADARRLTKEECKEILIACNKAGLVQNVNNFIDDLQFICNCCSCCCGIVQAAKAMGPVASGIVDATNFLPVVDQETCTGCGECTEKCPVEAMTLVNDVASVNRDQCLGCGFCATLCPTESITLTRIGNKAYELGDTKVGFGFGD
ncbi:MAG: 4Fe-4S binding protein [Desulfobacterales bacterium]